MFQVQVEPQMISFTAVKKMRILMSASSVMRATFQELFMVIGYHNVEFVQS